MGQVKMKVFAAEAGDSFLISFNDEGKKNILIDMGFRSTYNKQIKKELVALNSRGESIDLLVFTHIDQDHINGGIALLEENGLANNPNIVSIKEIWFNTNRHLNFTEKKSIDEATLEKLIKTAKEFPKPRMRENYTGEIGFAQGNTLSKLICCNLYNWNTLFDGNAVVAPNKIDIGLNTRIYILSPTLDKLEDLSNDWKTYLIKKGLPSVNHELCDHLFEMYIEGHLDQVKSNYYGRQCGFEKIDFKALAEHTFEEDVSITNGSSIAFILEHYDTMLLFLGDAYPSVALKGLENHFKDIQPHFKLVKVSHHGSKYSTSCDLLSRFSADKFLISTNGNSHKHPDVETIARIIETKQVEKKEIIFNYKPSFYEVLDQQKACSTRYVNLYGQCKIEDIIIDDH